MVTRAAALRAILGQRWPAWVSAAELIRIAEAMTPAPAPAPPKPRIRMALSRSAASRAKWAIPAYRDKMRRAQVAGQRRRFGTAHLTDRQYTQYKALIEAHYRQAEALAIVGALQRRVA